MGPFGKQIAVVTGGASGIGCAICRYLAVHGAHVVIADRDERAAEKTAAAIGSAGGSAESVVLDVSESADVETVIRRTAREHGRIDYLFNNAGVSVNGEFQDLSPEHLRHVMNVNFWGTVFGCRSVYPIMVRQGCGHIVNTASLAGLIPGGLTTIYSASKHAVVGLSLTLRSEAKQYGIKVSALCPGYLRTNIQQTTENVSEYMNSRRNRNMNEQMNFLTPEDCIEDIMRAIRKNRGIIVVPARHRIYWWIHRIAPDFIPSMFHRIIIRMKRQAD